MTTRQILKEDWSEYDMRKEAEGADRSYFVCTEEWEVEYLMNIIAKHFLFISRNDIRQAINSCCVKIKPPMPRAHFVEHVMRKLGFT